MGKGKLLNISLLIFLLLFLIQPPGFVEGVYARGEIWRVLEFNSGQCFTYELKRGSLDLETIGEITFRVSDSQDEMIRLISEGNFKGETFKTSSTGKAGDKENILMNLMTVILTELPYEVNEVLTSTIFFSPWLEIPLDKLELIYGYEEYITDSNDDSYLLKILNNKRKYAGIEGFLIRMEQEEEEVNIEKCINPELPLPLMAVRDSEEEGVFAAELTNYTTDSDVSEWEKSRAVLESELMQVVEYFRTNNLQIGERQPKSYKMIGAAGGFGLEVEGGEIELYIFDRETAEKDVLTELNKARDTGEFYSIHLDMEMPVVLNENMMLITGYRFGEMSITHPEEEKIITIFKEFRVN
ncbi:MAG: hypothetical protein ACOCQ2_01215 [Halanaerobiales bacterium]